MSEKPGGVGEDSGDKTFVSAAPAPSARNRGILTATAGSEAGRVLSLPLGKAVTFGRSDECDFAFADGSLSRVHARVVSVAGNYVLEDMNSTNGAYVNDARVAKRVTLRDGDRIALGTATAFRFSLVSADEERALQRVYEASTRDGLTGLYNRKHLDERLEAEVAFALRHGAPLSVLMMDIDRFKQVNDTWGHPAGDAVIRALGALLARDLRVEDVAGRYGGEEFLVVLRGIAAADAQVLAERLRKRFEQSPVEFEGRPLRATVSAGVASLACCGEKPDRDALVRCADARLYEAKQGGRNRVVGPG